MNGLPNGWSLTSAIAIAEPIRGVTYKKEQARNLPADGHIALLRANNIQRDQLDLSDLVYVPSANIAANQLLKKNDVVIAMSSGSISVVGKSAQINADLQVSFGAFCGALRPCSEIEPRYLGHFLKSDAYRQGISNLARGVNINNLKWSHFEEIPLPLAPLPEQKRIADKLDAVLARVDACRDRLDRLPALLKRFRQSILAAATSGRLTEDWREGESILSSWRQVQLGDYVENHDGKRVPISEVLRTTRRGSFPYYGASGAIDTIDSYTHEGKYLLIGEDGANLLTRTKPIAFLAEGKIWVNNHAHVLKCKDGAPEEYLGYFINSIDLTPYVSGSAQPKLNQKNMNAIVIPVPPIPEQHEIVRRVETLFAFADRLEARLATARQQVDQLTPALLAKAFRGELVPQDPADESASELLKRLAAQRAETDKVAKPKRSRKAAQ